MLNRNHNTIAALKLAAALGLAVALTLLLAVAVAAPRVVADNSPASRPAPLLTSADLSGSHSGGLGNQEALALANVTTDGWLATRSAPETASPVEGAPAPQAVADVPGATDTWWAGVQAQLRRESYRLSPDPDGQRGYNRAHNFVLSFGAASLRLSSNNDKGNEANDARPLAGENSPADVGRDRKAWSWNLRLMGHGYAGDIRPVDQPLQATARGNRFEYHYPSEIVEWYINDERGLEHGFTLSAPPPRNSVPGLPVGQLTLNLALATNLTPHLSPDQQTIDFRHCSILVLPHPVGERTRWEGEKQSR